VAAGVPCSSAGACTPLGASGRFALAGRGAFCCGADASDVGTGGRLVALVDVCACATFCGVDIM